MEAKNIFIRRNPEITQEEYEQLEPFSLDDENSRRFDEIGELFWVEGSELYQIER